MVYRAWTSPVGDDDCDGFTTAIENFIGTDPNVACAATAAPNDEPPPDKWPLDFNNDQLAGLADVATHSNHFGARASDPPGTVPIYAKRWDLNGDGRIGLQDVTMFSRFFGKRCAP
jgi:hypothetical protein